MEVNDAQRAHLALTSGDKNVTRWIWWAPGDFTRYRVTHVVAHTPYGLGGTNLQFLLVSVGATTRDVVMIQCPPEGFSWTPEKFLAEFGEKYVGWWAGIRPMLAAFGWTSTRADDLAYSSRDAEEIGALL